MEKRHEIFCARDFLNKPYNHSDGSIYSRISVHESEDFVDLSAQLKIRDCERPVHLSIYPGSEEELENAVFKVDIMIEHLYKLRQGLIKGHKLYAKLKKQQEVRRKKKEKSAEGKDSRTVAPRVQRPA